MATKTTRRAKPKAKKPSAYMVEMIINHCEYPDCDHSFCAPDNLEPIKDYALKVTKSFGTMDGDYWEGTVYLNEKPIIHVFNEGYGGPNFYHQIGDDRTVVEKYIADAKQAFPRLDFEPEEALTAFLDICFQNFND